MGVTAQTKTLTAQTKTLTAEMAVYSLEWLLSHSKYGGIFDKTLIRGEKRRRR